jgi:hypothetical protein
MTELAPSLPPTPEDRLAQAEAMVRAYCGWHIAPSRDTTAVLDGGGGHTLLLRSLYVTDVASVTEDGVLLDPATDYTWSEAGILHRLGIAYYGQSYGQPFGYGWWSSTLRGITVEFTHGYAEVPPDVTAVVQAAAQRLTDNPTGLASQTVGPFTEQYGTATSGMFASSDMAVLDRYRLPWGP